MNTQYYEKLWFFNESPYYLDDDNQKDDNNELLEQMYVELQKIETSNQLGNFIEKIYNNGLSGSIFGRTIEIARNYYNNKDHRLSILNSDKICHRMISELKSLSKDEFKIKASYKVKSRCISNKPEKFLQKECVKLEFSPAENGSEFLVNDKSFLTRNYRNILKEIGIMIPGDKEIDGAIKIHNTIIVLEAKKQNEGGGGQKLSKGDGLRIFSTINNSNFSLIKIFCLDGIQIQYDEKNDQKVMSIFDVPEYIRNI